MNTATIPSLFVLTLVLATGLFFFIRASAKDRTEQIELISQQPEATLMAQLQQYFDIRAYRVASIDKENNSVTFTGMVRPSIFLAMLLTILASAGILSLVLALSLLFPNLGKVFLLLVLASPAAGIFYWKKAGRIEQVSLKLQPTSSQNVTIWIKAHRDEILELRQAIPLTEVGDRE
ncbi:cofactor assembly of complex C subunit B [Synechocystis sp. PCC 7509]|uniref:cofactor assembly of complex C subunit B n=1 Tax=Synechocystis sp. PCC 7509 TaxID=927677 RepID=UPI0002AC05F5|nr:cofactor assembly of complex C subunit B [Synechocystis sp. PCC 7509]